MPIMKHATVCAYQLPGGPQIEAVEQRDGSFLWAVRLNGRCLNKSFQWEWEPLPSSRDDEFYGRCRFQTPELAYQAWDGTYSHG